MVKGHGNKAFPQLSAHFMCCKHCSAYYKLEFTSYEYLDVDNSLHSLGICEVCGQYKPLMRVKNKQRNMAFAKQHEAEAARKVRRREKGKFR